MKRKTYIIRVESCPDNRAWYYNKKGRTFEAVMTNIKGKPFFVIDYIHKIPTQYATITDTKFVEYYKKY